MKKFTPTLLLCAFTFFLAAQTPQQLQLMAKDIGENENYFSSDIELKLPQNLKDDVAKTSTASIQLDSIYDYDSDNNGTLLFDRKYMYWHTASGLLSQVQEYRWQETAAIWEKDEKNEFFYDINGRMILEIQYEEYHGNWREDRKRETTYNTYGDVTEIIGYDADSTGWNLKWKDTYDYDSNGWVIESIEYSYENGAWDPGWKGEYTYNSTGLVLVNKTSFYDQGAWQNDQRRTYTYDANGNLTELIRENTDNGMWQNDRKETYAYDASDQDTLKMIFEWENNAWENYYKSYMSYDGSGNVLMRKDYYWQSGDWEKQYKWEFTYDANNNMTQRLFSTSYNDQWGYSSKYDYIFDAFDNMIREDRYSYYNGVWTLQEKDEWLFDTSVPAADIWCDITYPYYDFGSKILGTANYDPMGSAWEIQDSMAYYYSAIPFGIVENNIEKLKIYPNPTAGLVMVETNSTIKKELEVFDMLGNQIIFINTHLMNVELDMSTLPNGIYFIKVVQGERMSVNRIVKQ